MRTLSIRSRTSGARERRAVGPRERGPTKERRVSFAVQRSSRRSGQRTWLFNNLKRDPRRRSPSCQLSRVDSECGNVERMRRRIDLFGQALEFGEGTGLRLPPGIAVGAISYSRVRPTYEQPGTSAGLWKTRRPRWRATSTIMSAPLDAPPTRRTASHFSRRRSAIG